MKKITFTILFLAGFIDVFAQTSVTIVGTAHEPTAHLNADSILKVLNEIKPDIILQELDSSLMDNNGNYKGFAINNSGNEFVASRKYKAINNHVIFRRFDIEYRNNYYATHNTMAQENKLSNAVDKLYNQNLLSKDDMRIIAALYDMNKKLDELYSMDIKTLNSKIYMKVAEEREDIMYNKQLIVIGNTPQLKEYYDFYKDDGNFWTIRNKAMIANIVNYIKEFKGKRIVVLTGAMHKYFLTAGLEPIQSKLNFKLTDIPE